NLTFRVQFYMRAIHWSWRRALEVNCLVVIATAVTWALEFVLARFPVRRAAQVRAPRVNHEKAFRVLNDPDAILLLILGVYPDRVVARKSNFEDARRLEDGAWQEEADKHKETCSEETGDAPPDDHSSCLEYARLRCGLDHDRRFRCRSGSRGRSG